MKVAVITPFYKMIEVLPALVYCNLVSQTYTNIEYYIGDDTSPNFEEGLKLLEARGLLKIPRLNIFRLEERKPWSLGDIFNIVAHNARDADLLLFVCADILLMPDHVEQHVRIHKNRSKVAVEGALRLITKGEELKVLRNPSILPNVPLGRHNREPHKYDDPYCCPIDKCAKCTFLPHGGSVRRSDFSRVGGFRPEFSGSYSHFDLDLMSRLAVMGVYPKRSILPKAVNINTAGAHGEWRFTNDEMNKFQEEHGALHRAFQFGMPDNYINYNRTCRRFKMYVKNGERLR